MQHLVTPHTTKAQTVPTDIYPELPVDMFLAARRRAEKLSLPAGDLSSIPVHGLTGLVLERRFRRHPSFSKASRPRVIYRVRDKQTLFRLSQCNSVDKMLLRIPD
jgi:hypothetical protein